MSEGFRPRWIASEPPPEVVRALLDAGHSPVLARLLALRGIETKSAARAFLEPTVERLADPLAMGGLEAACERLALAAQRGERVFLVGDYDVDGIASSALLSAVFERCGIATEVQLPSRLRHGYGLHPSFVDRARGSGASLLVTVDCGSNATGPIADALAAGLEVIVLDHHLPVAELPAAVLHVNPCFEPPGSPFRDLAASGIAFELARALADRVGRPLDPARLARVACLGTIADMVPLRGENRVLTAVGLAALSETVSPGLRELIARAGLRPPLSASDVAFGLGPRINAPGRLADPDPALRLLLTRQRSEARALAEELESANQRRRQEEAVVVEAARRRIGRDPSHGVLVEWDETWHPGVLGIAAGRLAREFGRPTILLAVGSGRASGSGRGVSGIDLHAFLSPWAQAMESFGGHAQAIGLTVLHERLPELRQAWRSAADWPAESLRPVLSYELTLAPGDLTSTLLAELERLQPWGATAPEPLLRVGGLRPAGAPRRFGPGHLELEAVDARGSSLRMIGWRWADRADELAGAFDALGHLEPDRYRGGLRFRLVDVRRVPH